MSEKIAFSRVASQFKSWFESEILGGHYPIGSQTSIDLLVQASGFAKSSLKLGIRDLAAEGIVKTVKGRGITVRRIPNSPIPASVQSVLFIAGSAPIAVLNEFFELLKDSLKRILAESHSNFQCDFTFIALPSELDYLSARSLRASLAGCNAAVVAGTRSGDEIAFLRRIFTDVPMPVISIGSDEWIAERQHVVRSDDFEGSRKLIEALLDKLGDLATLDEGSGAVLPQVILVTDDLGGRNRPRIDGCKSILDERSRSGPEVFAWHTNSVWHPDHSLVRSPETEQYRPALRGKIAGRIIALKILNHLNLVAEVGSQLSGTQGSATVSFNEGSVLPRAVLVAMNAEVAEGVVESCVLRNVHIPGYLLVAATSGSFGRFGSFLSRSEPDSPRIADASARLVYSILSSTSTQGPTSPHIFAPCLHLRRSSRHVVHAVWRHAPSMAIKRVDPETEKMTYLYGNPVFEQLSGRPCSYAKGKTSVELWGHLAGVPMTNYDRITAGLKDGSSSCIIMSANWLPDRPPKSCHLTLRFPINVDSCKFGDLRLVGSIGFDVIPHSPDQSVQEITLMPLPRYDFDSAIDYPDEDLLQSFFESIPATVAVRTGRKVFYMNSTYARVIFGKDFLGKHSTHANDLNPKGIGAYFDALSSDSRHTVSKVGVHRLVRDQLFKNYKAPVPPKAIGDRWVLRFSIADSLFADGGEASVGFDAEILDRLTSMLKNTDTTRPFENRYVHIESDEVKGFRFDR